MGLVWRMRVGDKGEWRWFVEIAGKWDQRWEENKKTENQYRCHAASPKTSGIESAKKGNMTVQATLYMVEQNVCRLELANKTGNQDRAKAFKTVSHTHVH